MNGGWCMMIIIVWLWCLVSLVLSYVRVLVFSLLWCSFGMEVFNVMMCSLFMFSVNESVFLFGSYVWFGNVVCRLLWLLWLFGRIMNGCFNLMSSLWSFWYLFLVFLFVRLLEMMIRFGLGWMWFSELMVVENMILEFMVFWYRMLWGWIWILESCVMIVI